jgi:hypothetical protein
MFSENGLEKRENHPDVFPISWQDIIHMLSGYYIFAGRILSNDADNSEKTSRKVGEFIWISWRKGTDVL